jgi:lipoprotein-anchoring transpeptidase ErfK/SrfK
MSTFRDVTAQVPRGDVVAASAAAPAPRRRWGRRLAAIGALVVVAGAVVITVLVQDDGSSRPAARASVPTARPVPAPAALPEPSSSALTVPTPASVPVASHPTATWAPVRRSVLARSRPSDSAPGVALVNAQTPEGTDNIVQVVDRREVAGTLWVRARLAVLPNGTTGWLPRSAVGGLQFAHTRLVVNLGARKATLMRDGEAVLRVPIGVGRATTPTPTGSFYVRNRLADPSDPALGPVAFGTSARGGTGFIGIHGTNIPQAIPGGVSQGSIAMRNPDVRKLARLMPVGTPVTVRD